MEYTGRCQNDFNVQGYSDQQTSVLVGVPAVAVTPPRAHGGPASISSTWNRGTIDASVLHRSHLASHGRYCHSTTFVKVCHRLPLTRTGGSFCC
jgi:hypothetical protein